MKILQGQYKFGLTQTEAADVYECFEFEFEYHKRFKFRSNEWFKDLKSKLCKHLIWFHAMNLFKIYISWMI